MSKTYNNKQALALLFDLPLEPLLAPRDKGKAVFELTDFSKTNRNLIGGSAHDIPAIYDKVKVKVAVPPLVEIPDLSFTEPLENRKHFSLFTKKHQLIAARLIELLMKAPNQDQFVSLCVYCKDRVSNPFLFQYCYAVALQHRQDTQDVPVKSVVELFPQNFIPPGIFQDTAVRKKLESPEKVVHIVIPPNFTATDQVLDQRVAYFREDLFVNSHHWHWHVVYPGQGDIDIVKKDRRGELFYYMHHQLMARYDVERFCNDLPRAASFDKFSDISEAYFPKILDSYSNRTFPSRVLNSKVNDINREEMQLEIAEMKRWADRISDAIDSGFVVDHKQKQIPLDAKKGIDILGNVVESTMLSVNITFYGNLHNYGHMLIAYTHDPDGRFLEDPSVMGDISTAMRDPMFYRWHAFINVIFTRHKDLLDAYTRNDLEFKDVHITKVAVVLKEEKFGKEAPNTLVTHLETSSVDLVSGLDFGSKDHVYATFTHLQHLPFRYIINITNSADKPKSGTCRIFLCPKADESNTPLNLSDQRKLAIEMDKFTVNLTAGPNVIERESSDSSVTVPFQSTLGFVERNNLYCGCGWPDHMLLPRGKPEGMSFDLFVMISDHETDTVLQAKKDTEKCKKQAPSYCGLKDKLYPDSRTMGYPFDRRLQGDYLEKDNITNLAKVFKNMSVTDVVIRFQDAVVDAK